MGTACPTSSIDIQAAAKYLKVPLENLDSKIGGQNAWDDNRALKNRGERRFLTQFPDDPTISWDTWKQDKRHFASGSQRALGGFALNEASRLAGVTVQARGNPYSRTEASLKLADAKDPPPRLILGNRNLPMVRASYAARLAIREEGKPVPNAAQVESTKPAPPVGSSSVKTDWRRTSCPRCALLPDCVHGHIAWENSP